MWVGWGLHHLAVAGLARCQQASSLCGKWPVGNEVFVPSLHSDKSERDERVYFNHPSPTSPTFYHSSWVVFHGNVYFQSSCLWGDYPLNSQKWGLFAKHLIFSDMVFWRPKCWLKKNAEIQLKSRHLFVFLKQSVHLEIKEVDDASCTAGTLWKGKS